MSDKKIYRVQRQQNILWLRAAVGRNQDTPLLVRLLIDTGSSYTVLPIAILQLLDICNEIQRSTHKYQNTCSNRIYH